MELAAKAIGQELVYDEAFGVFGYHDEKVDWRIFDPLEDDGDALRLAVKLGLGIIQQHTFAGTEPVAAACGFGVEDFRLTSTDYNGDPLAATRRAIVRAAAEIGKSMP